MGHHAHERTARLGAAALLVAVGVAALACSEKAVPEALLGRWASDDPRYQGRSLVVLPNTLEIGQGEGRSEIVAIDSIESEVGIEGGTLYVIRYRSPYGDEQSLRLVVLPGSPASLRIENHSELWTRRDGGDAGIRRDS